MAGEVSVDGRIMVSGYTGGLNGQIALVESSWLPEGIVRTLHAAFRNCFMCASFLVN